MRPIVHPQPVIDKVDTSAMMVENGHSRTSAASAARPATARHPGPVRAAGESYGKPHILRRLFRHETHKSLI